jgi:hypothetical protein
MLLLLLLLLLLLHRDVKEPLPDRLKPLLGECWPAYEMLRQHALRPMPADSVPRCVPSHDYNLAE